VAAGKLGMPNSRCRAGAALVSQKRFNGQIAPWYAHHYINDLALIYLDVF
jgi:hypothetical protein